MRSRKRPEIIIFGWLENITKSTLLGFFVCLALVISIQAETVDDGTCLDCHDGLDKSLMFSPHRPGSTMSQPGNAPACADCHRGGEVHIEDPSADNIGNPAIMSGSDEAEICRQCHMPHNELDNYGFDIHEIQTINCSQCHKIHNSETKLLHDRETNFCLKCHTSVTSGFGKVSNHPLNQGALTCLSCHRFSQKSDAALDLDLNRVCQDCHPEQGGPWLYEHDATLGWSVEEGGCLECHQAHGSVNDRLLKQPRRQLCRNCHITPPGHINSSAHGYVWSDYQDCTLCHSQVHGSFENDKFLDPNLPAVLGTDCFASGCHNNNWEED